VHELNALLLEFGVVFQEPAGKHRREHRAGFRISGFFDPDVQIQVVDETNVIIRTGIEVINIGRDRVAFFVHTGDTADNAVAHHCANIFGIVAEGFDVIDTALNAANSNVQKLIQVHFNPACVRITKNGGQTLRSDALEILVIDRYLNALSTRIKA